MDPPETTTVEGSRRTPIRRWRRTLVADDSPMVRHLIVAKLKRFCIRIDVVADGLYATAAVLESLSSGSPIELILMDSQMPDMDGPEATRRIRDLGYSGPVISMTACAIDEVRREATASC